METVAPDVHRIALSPRDGLNAYLLGDVLVDAGLARSANTIIDALGGRTISEHVATHAHVDHVGGSAKVVAALGLDGVAVGSVDADAARTGRPVAKEGALGRAIARGGRFAPSRSRASCARATRSAPASGSSTRPATRPGRSCCGAPRTACSSPGTS